jgi:HD-GYP domain-containing protein (c-di-GMP phosphodiesterase class II)
MTADRPYRARRSVTEALAELDAQSGMQFDPVCVAALHVVLSQRRSVDHPTARLKLADRRAIVAA